MEIGLILFLIGLLLIAIMAGYVAIDNLRNP